MSPDRPKRLRMIAGPNGSGKSSIIRNLARERSRDGVFWLNHYLNADDVERSLVSTGLDLSQLDLEISLSEIGDALRKGNRIPSDHPFFVTAELREGILYASRGNGYLAASIVDFLREELMRRGTSFSFETVMSHHSKVDFFGRARAQGYKTYLYFVCTNSAEQSVARVRSRVRSGGSSSSRRQNTQTLQAQPAINSRGNRQRVPRLPIRQLRAWADLVGRIRPRWTMRLESRAEPTATVVSHLGLCNVG